MLHITADTISTWLPFKDDYIFKSMLTKPESEIFRNSMISAFTGLNIVSSELAENEPALDLSLLETPIRFDVNCITDDGTKVDIEMQAHTMQQDNLSNKHKNLRTRSLYYICKLFVGQEMKHYTDLKKAIQIMICDYNVFPDDKFLHKFYYRDGDTLLSDHCSIIYVELPKIKDIFSKPVDEMSPDERWAFFVEYVNDRRFAEKVSEFEHREEFCMALNTLSNISQSYRDQVLFTSRQKYRVDHAQDIYDASVIAEEKGKEEKLIETVLKLLRKGLSPEQTSDWLDLPLSKVEDIKSQH